MMKTITNHAKFYFLLLAFTFLLFTLNGFAQTCSPAPVGLVSWWRGENNALDSRSRNNGTLENGAGIAINKVGQVFNFTNQSQSVSIPNNPALFPATALSIEAWINPTDYAGCNAQYRIFHTVRTTLRGYVTFINCSNQKLVSQIFDLSGTANSITSNARSS